MSDYWDDHEQYDSEIEALRETLRKSVKEEIDATIKKLRTENSEMREKLGKLNELEAAAEQAVVNAKWALSSAKATAQREARKVRLVELLRTLDERLYSLSRRSIPREKCDRCDDKRQLPYVTPLGRQHADACPCATMDYVWRAEETVAHAVELQSDGSMAAWWLPVRAWGDDDAVGHRSLKSAGSNSVEVIAKDPRNWSFETLAAAEQMAELLNAAEAAKEPKAVSEF